MSILTEWKEDTIDLFLNVKFETLKNLKQKRIAILLGIVIILPLVFYLIPYFSNDLPSNSSEFLASIMGFTYMVLVVSAIFLGGDAINSEHYTKTALILYPLPQRRTIIYLGKYLTQLLTSWVVVGIYYGINALITGYQYGFDTINLDMFKSLLFSFIFMAALLAIAFYLSTLLMNPAASMTLTFFTLFMLLPITSMILRQIDVDTTWILTNYSGLITKFFRFPTEIFGPGQDPSQLDFEHGILVSLVYFLVFYVLGWYNMLNKEV